MRDLDDDLIILGVAGKMGVTLARMARRAYTPRRNPSIDSVSSWEAAGLVAGLACMGATWVMPGLVAWILPALVVLYQAIRWLAGDDLATPLARAKRTLFGVIYPFVCLAFYLEIGRMEAGFGYVILYYGLAK